MSLERADLILQGAVDTHAHAHPEYTLRTPPRLNNVAWAHAAAEAGMRAFVMKSHFWPTTMAAHMLNTLGLDVEVFGSITLNPISGGLDPIVVEIAAETGAKVVWMPTWSARQEPPKPSPYFERVLQSISGLDREQVQGDHGLTILDDDGELLPEVSAIVQVCADRSLTLASGHLPVSSTLVLAREAARQGARFVFTHPLAFSVDASIEQQQEVAKAGGFVEHVYVGCMPMHRQINPKAIAESIRAVGVEHCIMASDAIEGWNPPAPEILRMYISAMLALGFSDDEVHLMTHDNPARALGLPVEEKSEAEVG